MKYLWILPRGVVWSNTSFMFSVHCNLYLQCSKSCGTGYRTREVKCLDPNQQPSAECPARSKPRTREPCNTQSCVARPKPTSKSGGVALSTIWQWSCLCTVSVYFIFWAELGFYSKSRLTMFDINKFSAKSIYYYCHIFISSWTQQYYCLFVFRKGCVLL